MVIKRCMEQLAPDSETRLYLEDIHDHVITMSQNLSHYEQTMARYFFILNLALIQIIWRRLALN